MKETLTKENFWNAVELQFPKSTKLFRNWIDEYKKEVNWNKLFNAEKHFNNFYNSPKFHEIPYAMQQGIWIEFVAETLDQFFEQPEYEYSFDLEEDIKSVFSEIEELIDSE